MATCAKHIIHQFEAPTLRAFVTFCKGWRCDECCKFRLRKLRREAYDGEPDMMLTLTVNPAIGDDKNSRAKLLSTALNKLIKRIKYNFRLDRLPYFAVMEATERGEPHLHVLLRSKYIPHKWLVSQWKELTGASIVHVTRLQSARKAACYVSKYISKAPAQFGSTKRYWRSKDWSLASKKEPSKDWSSAKTRVLKHTDLALIVAQLKAEGWTITRTAHGYVEATAPHSGCDPPLWSCAQELDAMPKRRRHSDWQTEKMTGSAGVEARPE